MPTVVLSPLNVVNFLEGAGHFWVYMQYALGLRSIGCQVYWLEHIRRNGDPEAEEARLAGFLARMETFGLGSNVILYSSGDAPPAPAVPRDYVGRTRSEAEAIFASADLLLNFHYTIAPELLVRFRRTALVDIDPGLLQFWISRGQLEVPPHDFYVTTGETVGTTAARFPDCGLEWIHIHPPISVEHWPYTFAPQADAFTTVSNWDSDDWIVDGDEVYENTKRVAFLEFANLPRLTDQPLELALYLRTESDARDRRELERRGWSVRHSQEVAGTPELYQEYIQSSRGEFSCAKRSCVRYRNAWISDRTLCYLASGKPVVVQDTGPSSYLPNGEGMFRFTSLKESALALEAVSADYERHSRAARRIAHTLFDARRVLSDLLGQVLD